MDYRQANYPSGYKILLTPENGSAREASGFAELLLDTDQLVVFRQPVRTRERSRLDLAAIRGDGEIGYGRVLGFARTVRHHRAITGLVRHLHRFQRFAQRADLVNLDENGVRHAAL